MSRSHHIITIVILLILFPYPLFSQNLGADSVQQFYELSMKAYQAKDFREFYRLSSKIVDLKPEEYTYRYNLACASALTGNTHNAVQLLGFLLDEDYDLALLAEADGDYSSIRGAPEFQPIIARIREKTKPLNKSSIAFSIPEKDLIPEGIAYDPVKQTFYLSSLQKCKIIAIDKQKRIVDFVTPQQEGLLPVLGMKVDAGRRILWAISSYGFYNPAIPRELLGMSGVFKYDLLTGKLLKKYMLPQAEKHFLNDLTICPNGDVYITDWLVYGIYKIAGNQDTLTRYLNLPRSPNGIDCSSDGGKLFIAGDGIGVLDLHTRNFQELKHPPHMYLSGDGLYYYQNSLIAIQDRKVTRFYLGEDQMEISRAEALEAYHPLFSVPTTGVLVGNQFYYTANSQLWKYDAEGRIFPLSRLEETTILQLELQVTGR